MFWRKTLKVVTHDSSFHADDVCAVAVLSLLYGSRIRVIRSRDPKIIERADIVLDVGGKNDGVKFFDHHQIGGAGKRQNGVPYAAFGLIWKRFGVELCRSEAVAKRFDEVFVQPTDANDNGLSVISSVIPGVSPITLDGFVFASNPTWKESELTRDKKFFETVQLFKKIISRELVFLAHEEDARIEVLADYAKAGDKRLIVLSKNYPARSVFKDLPEPLFVVYPRDGGRWGVKAVRSEIDSFKNKKDLPLEWAGKKDEELAKISGVSDAIFCHNGRFMAVAGSRAGAIKLAQIALLS